MKICTCKGNVYTYLRETNEIIGTPVDAKSFAWNFKTLQQFESFPNLDTVILSITETCNLRCTYCCYSGNYQNNRSHSTSLMSTEDIDEVFMFIQQYLTRPKIYIAFYGGEPLTNFQVLKYAILKARTLWGNDIELSVSTNAVLLTPEKIDWFVEQNVRLDISIDGGKTVHDKNRVTANGQGSFCLVYSVLRYIHDTYPEYLKENVLKLMTIDSLADVLKAAEEWSQDDILSEIEPSKISSLAPNFSKDVPLYEYNNLVAKYIELLDKYEAHKDWNVLRVFFEQCIAYWLHRPVLEVDESVPMATCLPLNNKLYVDTKKRISVCEKFCDSYHIGNVAEGIDWKVANTLVQGYYNKRFERCKYCPAVRMCNLCLMAVEYSDSEWNVLCNNEQVLTKVNFRLFCEMAERGLLQL